MKRNVFVVEVKLDEDSDWEAACVRLTRDEANREAKDWRKLTRRTCIRVVEYVRKEEKR